MLDPRQDVRTIVANSRPASLSAKPHAPLSVLFVYPNITGQHSIQLGLASLIAVTRQQGHQCQLFDTTFLPPNSAGHELRQTVTRVRPDLLAVSCRSYEWGFVESLLAALGSQRPLTIVGGPHATCATKEVIRSSVVDMAAIGEGESTLTELLSHLASGSGVEGISGLWTKTGGQIHRTPPGMLVGRLDTLPAPDWELFDSRHLDVNYFVKGKMLPMRLGFFETGRGCPSSCPYCINEHLHTLYRDVDKYERRKPVQSLIEEISEKVHRYKLQYVFLIDDWLALRSKRVQRFFDAYRDQIKLPFTFLTRPEEITEKATANAVSAGAAMVGIGIECGDEQLRRGLLRRRMSNKTIINAFTICRHLGLSTHSYNMIGLPFETRSSIQATISLNQKASPDFVGVSIFYPFPGTSLRALCEERGLLRAESDVVRKTFHSATAIKGPLGAGRLARLRVLIPHMVFCRSRLGRAWLSTCERSTLAFRVFSSLEQRKQGHLSMYGNGG